MGLTEGALIGSYRILGKLGEGGMGAVYRAVDSMLNREVAIKALRPEIASQPDVLERFRSEAVLLAKLNHPAIAQLYAFFSEGGQFYMVMEYVAGDTFERVIQQQGAMGWQRAFGYMIQILDGISHAHAAGILHRDLKPANVMLTPTGKIKLMDFGIAQALGGARMTRQGRIIGTLEYLAPERIQGKPADIRSDLYAVGVMLFEMLSGRLPFHSESEYELLQQQIQQAPPTFGSLGVTVPPEVEAVVRTALEKDPERRYATAEDFAAALAALAPTRSGSAGNTGSRIIPAPVPVALPTEAQVNAAAVALPVAAGSSGIQGWMAKPVFWLGSAGALLLIAATLLFASLRSRPVPAALADSGQPPIFEPQQSSLKVDTTPVVIAPRPATEAAPQAPVKEIPPAPVPVPQQVTPKQARSTPRETTPSPSANPTQTPMQPVPVPAPTSSPVVERTASIPPAPAPNFQPARGGILRLSDARSIFVAGGQGELDGYIRQEIQQQLGVRMRLAASIADADVVMRVTLDEQRGKLSSAGRMFGVKDHTQLRAVVVDARTSHVIWQQGAGDRKIGSFRGESLKRLAERIVKELRQSM
jgi:serine/threonine-protein kinase